LPQPFGSARAFATVFAAMLLPNPTAAGHYLPVHGTALHWDF
jgi:hypothetical protein